MTTGELEAGPVQPRAARCGEMLAPAEGRLRARRWGRAIAAAGVLASAGACALAFATVAEHWQARREREARELVVRARAACESGERDRCIELLRRAASLTPESATSTWAEAAPQLHRAHRAQPAR